MKKIFKGLSILVASTALCGGIAMATACDSGYNGEYTGEYHYTSHDQEYGMKVKVTVENNIITKVEDVTGDAYISVSDGWEAYVDKTGGVAAYAWAYADVEGFSTMTDAEKEKYVDEHPISWYTWLNSNNQYWKDSEAWLLQQYEGKSVAEILDIKVFVDAEGVPYKVTDDNNQARNPQLKASELLIGGATQGSGRLLLAVQNALKK